MSRHGYQLFSEGRIGSLKLKNRLIRSATFEAGMTEDGRATDGILDLYRHLAEGGVGLIVTGAASVTPLGKCNGQPYPKMILADDDTRIREVARIADAVHGVDNGCKVVAQLLHAGGVVPDYNDWADSVGPSAIPSTDGKRAVRALEREEIRCIVGCFAQAIARVKEAGFDGAQLHGAHGYLLSSFLSPHTNHRIDAFGGSVENRVRIVREIVERAREKVGDFPIVIKVNCDDEATGDVEMSSFPALAAEIERAGVDAVEVSGQSSSRKGIADPDKQSYYLSYAERLALGVPVILGGGNRNVESMERIVRGGKVEFLAMSRPLIGEPDLPNRWLEGRGGELADCVSCNRCYSSLRTGVVRCLREKTPAAA